MYNAYSHLSELVKNKSNIADPKEFHSIVNVVFHDHESEYYDKIHKEMWKSLPQQFELLANDALPFVNNKFGLKLLDLGCGTGLATEFVLRTPLNDKISEVHLLDTSSKMLSIAKKRAKGWKKQIKAIEGDIMSADDNYDIIIISSVLHHIPDLQSFLSIVSTKQNPGGILITMHDPAAESLKSEIYKSRCEEFTHTVKSQKSIYNRIINRFKRLLNNNDYIQKVNSTLLRSNVIKRHLTEVEIWSITDVHVEGLPYSASQGISTTFLLDALNSYTLIKCRTYSFYGTATSNLNGFYQQKEQELIGRNDQHGRNFSSLWIKQI